MRNLFALTVAAVAALGLADCGYAGYQPPDASSGPTDVPLFDASLADASSPDTPPFAAAEPPRTGAPVDGRFSVGSCFVPPVVPYRVAGFGHGDAVGGGLVHAGHDVAAAAGATVLAPLAGTVSFAGAVEGGGVAVAINGVSPDGVPVQFVLAQLGSSPLRAGDAVARGGAVGLVGPLNHLHFHAYLHPSAGRLSAGHVRASELADYADPVGFMNAHGGTACGGGTDSCELTGPADAQLVQMCQTTAACAPGSTAFCSARCYYECDVAGTDGPECGMRGQVPNAVAVWFVAVAESSNDAAASVTLRNVRVFGIPRGGGAARALNDGAPLPLSGYQWAPGTVTPGQNNCGNPGVPSGRSNWFDPAVPVSHVALGAGGACGPTEATLTFAGRTDAKPVLHPYAARLQIPADIKDVYAVADVATVRARVQIGLDYYAMTGPLPATPFCSWPPGVTAESYVREGTRGAWGRCSVAGATLPISTASSRSQTRCEGESAPVTCTPPLTLCGTACVNTATDRSHCGGCDHPCAAGQDCSSSTCTGGVPSCAGVTCQPCQTCVAGACVAVADGQACTADDSACTNDVCSGGGCTHPMRPSDCGDRACGPSPSGCYMCGSCTAPRTCSPAGRCVEPCDGVVCPACQTCSGGSCVPAAGMALCAGQCVNTTNDPANCGGCGTVCPAPSGGTASCAASACGTACPVGQTNCAGSCRTLGASCVAGMGACARSGTVVCSGSSTGCGATAGTPSAETCDNLDNDCDGATDEGLSRSCYTGPGGTQGQGLCRAGTQSCGAGSWGACSGEVLPATETCNGTDDDCDGLLDEGCACTPGASRACYGGPTGTAGTGLCRAGTQSCLAGGVWGACAGEIRPAAEACDNLDNDCDGATDEGLSRACYTGPGGTQGQGLCRAGAQSCGAGSWGACSGEVLPATETCNGSDDDCDGLLDEGCICTPGTSRACYGGPAGTAGTGLCRAGTQSCLSGSAWSACAGEVGPAAEVCDNLDNDCDGATDEGLSRACYTGPAGTEGRGACRGGTQTCASGAWGGGCAGQVVPAVEICNGLDDNCDGRVDETCACTPGASRPCYSGAAGTQDVGPCRGGMQTCASVGGGAAWGACAGETVPATEVCDGRDNDCDRGVDESFPEAGSTCVAPGTGACARGARVCQGGALGCVSTVGPTSEVCGDGVDNDCDGATDEGCLRVVFAPTSSPGGCRWRWDTDAPDFYGWRAYERTDLTLMLAAPYPNGVARYSPACVFGPVVADGSVAVDGPGAYYAGEWLICGGGAGRARLARGTASYGFVGGALAPMIDLSAGASVIPAQTCAFANDPRWPCNSPTCTDCSVGFACCTEARPCEWNCRNNFDDDGDGLTDCEDPNCSRATARAGDPFAAGTDQWGNPQCR